MTPLQRLEVIWPIPRFITPRPICYVTVGPFIAGDVLYCDPELADLLIKKHRAKLTNNIPREDRDSVGL